MLRVKSLQFTVDGFMFCTSSYATTAVSAYGGSGGGRSSGNDLNTWLT